MSIIYIVIPAFNEESTIRRVIEGLRENGYKNIIIVDDGSKDDTRNVVMNMGVEVLSHPINMGQGAALKTGIDYALKLNADIIVTFDADGQHLVEEVVEIIEPVIKKQADITLGSRFLNKKSNIPFFRKIMLKGGILLTFFMYGIKLSDTHNGFRAMSSYAAEKIEIKSRGMEHASEIIEEIKKKKLKYREIPVTIRYTDYSLKKGQKISNSIVIFSRMLKRWLIR